MPKRPSDETRKKDNDGLVEIAAEQFARLFWKQWLYMKYPEGPKSREHQTNKNENRSS